MRGEGKVEVEACWRGQEKERMRRRRRRGRRGEVGIADGDGDGRVNVLLALALGHGKLRPTTQSSSLLCTERARERNALGGGDGGAERGRGPAREEARG